MDSIKSTLYCSYKEVLFLWLKQVENWVKKYRKNPELLKQDLRGKSSTSRPKSIKLEDMTLEEQNIYLRMENDILKTLRALLKK